MASDTQEKIQMKGQDVSPTKDGCLLKEILREGSDDEKPLFDDTVFIHYTGTHLDGTVFETSRDQPRQYSFSLGRGDVIKAWDIGVATMKRGELARFISKAKYAYGLKGLNEKVASAETVIFEIELFDFEGKDISKDRDHSVLRRILKRGDGSDIPNEDASVEVILKGTHQGEVFDERTITFIAGAGCIYNIPLGVEQAVFRMFKNEQSKLYLTSKATQGVEKFNIPSDSPVEYEVTLIKVEKLKEERNMDDEQKLEQSAIVKLRADEWVKRGYYQLAAKRYKYVFNILLNTSVRTDSEIEKSRKLKFGSQMNLSLCHLKLGEYEDCKRAINFALAFDAQNEKAIFRRGQCQLALRYFDEAIQDFETVLKINPSNDAAAQQLQQCRQEIKAHKIKEKEMYHSFLNRKAKTNTTSTTSA